MPRRPDRFLVLGALLIAGQLGVRAWALSGSWFYFDDLAFMSRAMNQPFDADYLLESYGGHLMPAGFAVVRLLTDWAAYEWWPWALTLLVLQAVAAIGFFRLLVSMFGRRPFVLVLLAVYLFWVFTLSAGIWFAAGINQLPLQIALGFGLTAHLAYLRTRRTRHLVATLLWTVFGLLFYEKTMILFGIYALVALCWFGTGNTPVRLRGLWDRYRLGIVAHGLVAAGYLAAYVHWGLDFGLEESADVAWGPIAWNLVGVALSAGLVGGPITWQALNVGSLADPSDLLLLASWAGVAGTVAYAVFSRVLSKRAWSLLGFTMLANVVLLASARAAIVGPEIGREYRYQTESAAVAALCLGLAFLPLRGAVEQNAPRAGVPRSYEGRAFVGGVALVVTALALVSTVRYVDLWQSRNDSPEFFRNARTTLAAAPEHPVPLVDRGIPQTLLWSFRFPENSYRHVLRPYADKTSFPRSAVDELFILDDDGRLAPVTIDPARSMKRTGGCGYRLEDDTTTIPLDGPVLGGGWWIEMSYEAPRATSLTLTAGEEIHDLELPAGEHDVFVQAAGEFDEVELSDYPRGSDLCVTDLVLGAPVPDSSS
ncbi:hypothetical protein KM427_11430 [Nocardioides sp. LMS-CY]|uniref:hypothetical protein n=1 Tax=Nocardioides sp. (strain LMS-CY) TaxID=2840457 RepID=UPI001C005941|nr:hypothetical protein [Nocardioides sp. LMS-CY]QWF24242.1 hypothetical protein KM427_11430 [Nocardioides sp. LMS-CY]